MGKTCLTFSLIALQVYQVKMETILQFRQFAHEIAMWQRMAASAHSQWTTDYGLHGDADSAWNKSFQKWNVSIILEYISRRHTIKIKNALFWLLVRSNDFMKWKDKHITQMKCYVSVNDAINSCRFFSKNTNQN